MAKQDKDKLEQAFDIMTDENGVQYKDFPLCKLGMISTPQGTFTGVIYPCFWENEFYYVLYVESGNNARVAPQDIWAFQKMPARRKRYMELTQLATRASMLYKRAYAITKQGLQGKDVSQQKSDWKGVYETLNRDMGAYKCKILHGDL